MRCVECAAPVRATFREYANGTLKLATCVHCGAFADCYIEYDLTLIVLDMILYKPQAYRHLVFNHMQEVPRSSLTGLPTLFDFLTVLLVLLDAYVSFLTHYCTEDTLPSLEFSATQHILAVHWDKLLPVILVTALSYVAMLAGVLAAVLLLSATTTPARPLDSSLRSSQESLLSSPTSARRQNGAVPSNEQPQPFLLGLEPTQIACTLLLASYGKLLLILLLIWEYPAYFTILTNCIVLSSELLALRACLPLTPSRALFVLLCGLLSSQLVLRWQGQAPPVLCPSPP